VSDKRIVVVGGGLAGLMSVIKICEAGIPVDLISVVPVKRSHSVCAQGGINSALDLQGKGDSPFEHFDDTVYGGDFLANQTPVKKMCEKAPEIVHMLDRMGVMFNRTNEGNLDVRAFGGAKYKRTVFAGATTGQQLIYALDEQVRRFKSEGLVTEYIGCDFQKLILDEKGRARGVIIMDMKNMTTKALPAAAVVVATGGPGYVFGKSTNSFINTGSVATTCYYQGAKYANGEFIQVHPTAIPGEDKNRLMSESARGEGGRVWTYKDGKPWYFLEEKYPAYGNLVTRDIATREIFDVCVNQGLGIDGKNMVYLDLSFKDPDYLDRKLGGIMEIYEKFVGEDPRKVPMKVFPSVHYSMGGLWVDMEKNMTSIDGLFAAGEVSYQYHGGNRLGANALLSCIYDGFVSGPAAAEYAEEAEMPSNINELVEKTLNEVNGYYEKVYSMEGSENARQIHAELGKWMTERMTIVRYNDKLKELEEKLKELEDRWNHIGIVDKSRVLNQEVIFVKDLQKMIQLARVMTVSAIHRDESRGAHYKPEFPERNDEKFLKTTIAEVTADGPKISYEEVDTSLIKPRLRNYAVDKSKTKDGEDK
jgi:succinate dehydrogenase / fumarate reductase flavoprotein subunit